MVRVCRSHKPGGLPLSIFIYIIVTSCYAVAFNCDKLLQTARYRKQSFTGCQVLAPRKAVLLWFAKDDADGKNGDIYFRLIMREANPQLRGWMGLGFSDMGAMTGSDVIIIHKKQSGSGYTATDAHALGFFTPKPDKSQDVVLLDYKTRGDQMSATFTRKFKTCDADDDHEIQRGLGQYLIWGHGEAAAGLGFYGIQYHGTQDRGYVQRQLLDLLPRKRPRSAAGQGAEEQQQYAAQAVVPSTHDQQRQSSISRLTQLMQSYYNPMSPVNGNEQAIVAGSQQQQQQAAAAADTEQPIPLPQIKDNGDGTYETDILCKVPEIPAVETTYMVCYVRLPDDKKYHITSYTTVYGNRELVHHSVVYACLRTIAEPQMIELVKKGGPGPYNQEVQRMLCEVFYMVGPAPSSPTYTLPDSTGLPFGKDTYRYFAIEVHYNNPQFKPGQSDPGTGLKLKFQSADIRPHDVGILTVSQFILDIPPRQATVVANTTVCSRKCTDRFTRPVTMIAQFLHMHGLGKSIKTTRVRDGVELQPLATLRAFVYAYQTWTDIPDSERMLRPGDELSLTCLFDSSSRTEPTNWGFSTQEEMCFWWIYYYPAQAGMGICNSLGDTELVLCSDDVSDLQNLKTASDSGNETLVLNEVDKIRAAGRGINEEPQTVWVPYKPLRFCSDKPPAGL